MWRDIADTGIWQMNYTAHSLLLLLLYCYMDTCGTNHGAIVSIHVEYWSGSPCGDGGGEGWDAPDEAGWWKGAMHA